jgi:hypothetical protein
MTETSSAQPPDPGSTPDAAPERNGDRLVVVTPDGMAVSGQLADGDRGPSELIEEPAKVMRIGSMIKQLLEEVRNAPLDEAGRVRLAAIHSRSINELEQGLAPELVDELRRITLPFDESTTPSDAELRIAQAQLVGWLEGLFHGIQTALVAQRMASQVQLAQMRHALPPGAGGAPGPGAPGGLPQDPRQAPGQYL